MSRFEEKFEDATRAIDRLSWSEDDPMINLQSAIEGLADAVRALADEMLSIRVSAVTIREGDVARAIITES